MEALTFEEVERRHLWVHISHEDKGAEDHWYPQVPSGPYMGKDSVIEDFTTPRLCFAPRVHFAIKGKFCGFTPNDERPLYLYGLKKNVELVNLNRNVPSSPDNPYGPNFSWLEYARHKGIDPKDRDAKAAALLYCVPDLEASHEAWVVEPVTVVRIGAIDIHNKLVYPAWKNEPQVVPTNPCAEITVAGMVVGKIKTFYYSWSGEDYTNG